MEIAQTTEDKAAKSKKQQYFNQQNWQEKHDYKEYKWEEKDRNVSLQYQRDAERRDQIDAKLNQKAKR